MFAVVQNDPEVPPGALSAICADAGSAFTLFPAYASELPDPALFTGVVVLGGTMGVHDGATHPFLHRVRALMAQALRLEVPLLGICLGGQLLAQLLGGTVSSASCGERGIGQVTLTAEGEGDPLFAGISSPFTTFQWHDDSFLPPPGARLLASSPACPGQAFRIGRAYGVQFHPEVDRAIVSLWSDSGAPERWLADFEEALAPFERDSYAILANFIRGARHLRHP